MNNKTHIVSTNFVLGISSFLDLSKNEKSVRSVSKPEKSEFALIKIENVFTLVLTFFLYILS